MSEKLPWRRFTVEAALIVVSILLAFGIQAWWEDRQDRQQERLLLEDLYEEFGEARDTLVTAIDRHRQWGELSGTLAEVGLGQTSTVPLDAQPGLGHITSVLTGVVTTHLNTGVLDGALASGSLELISNPEIRSRLAAWPRTAGEFLEKQGYIWDLAVEVRPLLLASAPFADRLLAAPGLADRLGLSERESTGQPISPQFVDFLGSEVGRNYAAVRAMWESFAVRDGEKLLGAIDELLALIQGELS